MSGVFVALAENFAVVQPSLGAALCVLGAALAAIGTVGVLRFPDFYTRLHAASVTDTSSATTMLIGMALLSPDWLTVFKLAVIWVCLFLATPTATHAVANAAYTAGLQPWTRASAKEEEGETR